MSIVKMKRMKVMALVSDRDELISKLMSLGCAEISEPADRLNDPDWSALLSRDTSKIGEVKADSNQVSNALNTLKKYAPVKTSLFRKRDIISEEEFFSQSLEDDALKNAREIETCKSNLDRLESERVRLETLKAPLIPWQGLDMPLETTETKNVYIVMGIFPATSSIDEIKGLIAQENLLCDIITINSDKQAQYVVLICHKSDWENVQNILKPYSFSATRWNDMTGTAKQNIDLINEQLKNIEQNKQSNIELIKSHSGCRSELELMSDRLNQDSEKENAKERVLTNGTIIFLEGWTPAKKVDKVTALLEQYDAAYSFRDPLEGDDVPTLLEDPKWMSSIGMVTEMYAPPAYDGIDPNPLIFGWYIFFFGFMFADVAYGIIIFLVSHIIIKKTKPKGHIFYLGRWLGITTTICGFFVGGFFGDVITKFSSTFLGIPTEQLPGWLQTFCNGIIVNPVNDPMKVLIMALAIGFVQLVCGQCIHIYMEARDGHIIEGLLDVVPWWLFLGGIPVLLLLKNSVLIIVGVVALICTQGRHAKGIFGKIFGGISSLYDVTSWLSDILSYARLMALMLATSVIAMVFNTLAALPKILPVFIIIFLIGHSFNIGINLIGTYVHAARLQYLEFYGKFYKDGGRFFKPLKYNTKFVDIDEEE